jgi:hypothetical protein
MTPATRADSSQPPAVDALGQQVLAILSRYVSLATARAIYNAAKQNSETTANAGGVSSHGFAATLAHGLSIFCPDLDVREACIAELEKLTNLDLI